MAPTKKNYAKAKVWGERIVSTLEGPLMGVIVQMFTSVPADNHEYLLKKLQEVSDDMKGTTPVEPAKAEEKPAEEPKMDPACFYAKACGFDPADCPVCGDRKPLPADGIYYSDELGTPQGEDEP